MGEGAWAMRHHTVIYLGAKGGNKKARFQAVLEAAHKERVAWLARFKEHRFLSIILRTDGVNAPLHFKLMRYDGSFINGFLKRPWQ
jgi:hypothetical protein